MGWFSLLMPLMLMVHNTVDFRDNGAQNEYYQKLNYVMTNYIEMLEDCNNLRLVNKTGCMEEKISYLGLQFEDYDHHNINSARKLILALMDSFLDTINKSACLRPYLHCYPFTTENIEIRIHFVDTCKYSYPRPDEIKYVSFVDGTITYDLGNPRKLGEYEKLREESLYFARLIVDQSTILHE